MPRKKWMIMVVLSDLIVMFYFQQNMIWLMKMWHYLQLKFVSYKRYTYSWHACEVKLTFKALFAPLVFDGGGLFSRKYKPLVFQL